MTDKLPGYFKYWGKADPNYQGEPKWHPLVYHCLDVAAVGQALLKRQPASLDRLAILTGITGDGLMDWITFLLSIHDIGKCADGFQNLRPDLLRYLQNCGTDAAYLERHDTLGFRFCQESITKLLAEYDAEGRWGNSDQADLWDLLEPWIGAVTGHHGHPPKLDTFSPPLHTQFPRQVFSDISAYICNVADLLLPGGIPFYPQDYDRCYHAFRTISWVTAGIAVAADWIGSNNKWFPYCDTPMPPNEYWYDIALKLAKDAVTESGLTGITVARHGGIQSLFPYISAATPLQRLTEEIEIGNNPQLFIIEEVTGGGKTEAALNLAHRLMADGAADGLFIALPTMATANAMYSRVQVMYQKLFTGTAKPSLVLAHSFNRMVLDMEKKSGPDTGYTKDDSSASQDCAAWLLDSRKKALLAHVGVGTIDQALLSILGIRYQSLRLYGLSRKVLIADEVHACDAYVHRLLCTLLQFHAAEGGSAILLSATLPQRMREQLLTAYSEGREQGDLLIESNAYPLVTHFAVRKTQEFAVQARRSASRQVEVQLLYSLDDVKKMLHKVLRNGGCACWVRNTVYDALAAYREWIDLLTEDRVLLFHARFTLSDRLAMEQDVIGRFGPNSTSDKRRGKLLIATQVVEQSLDLDFDLMVTDLAPIDLIIQRAGRLQRHNRGKRMRPVLGVFMPEPAEHPGKDWFKSFFPKAAKVYDHHGQLWLTAKWLVEQKKFSMPDDARDMIESVYGESLQAMIPEELQMVENRADGEDRAYDSLGSLNSLNLNEGYRATMTHWQDDVYAPTRLGEPTIMVRLVRWDGMRITPWYFNNTGHDWELSQVSVRNSQIAKEEESYLPEVVATARKAMPDHGEHCVVIPLVQSGMMWLGRAVNSRGREVNIVYNQRTGLEITKGESDESD